MKKRTFAKEEKLKILEEAEKNGVQPILEKHAIYPATYYSWKKKFKKMRETGFRHGMTPGHLKEIRQLEKENKLLKKLLAEKEIEYHLKEDLSKLTENRHYKSTMLPTFIEESDRENQIEIAKEIYSEVHANYRHLADIRFKLLGFVPAISLIAWAEIIGNISEIDFQLAIIGLLIGLLGLRVTHGIRVYDQRNDELYDDLISRGRKIEDEWNIHTGIFKGRKTGCTKDVFKKMVNHGRGLSLIYSSVYLGWGLMVIYYVGNLINQFL